jgi:predicted Zn finger-like uncharacterized protein
MTLATRCPACQTAFKVVKDQLRLADGWVRCGRCDEVFLAADAMAQTEPEAPASSQVPRPSQTAEMVRATAPEQATSEEPNSGADLAHADPRVQVQAAEGTVNQALNVSTARPSTEQASEPPAEVPGSAEPELSPGTTPQTAPSEPLPEPIPEPSTPRRNYVWETATSPRKPPSPWATAGWAGLAGLGVASLVTQAALAWHDELLHAAPSLKPVLEVACIMADCRLEPVRRLQALSVESSQLSQLGGTIYEFSATVRNRSEAELAAPALDLVLTGSDGQVIARKVLRWADFGLRSRSMAAQQEVSLQTNLNTGTTAVAGFTIELFYP